MKLENDFANLIRRGTNVSTKFLSRPIHREWPRSLPVRYCSLQTLKDLLLIAGFNGGGMTKTAGDEQGSITGVSCYPVRHPASFPSLKNILWK